MPIMVTNAEWSYDWYDIIKKTTQTHSGSHIVLHERQLVG